MNMLPLYIIEELEQNRREEPCSEMYIECPEFELPEIDSEAPAEDKPERGVAIVDFTI